MANVIETLEDRKLLTAAPASLRALGAAALGAIARPGAELNRVSGELLGIYLQQAKGGAASASSGLADRVIRDDGGRVGVRVTARDVAALTPGLQALGFRVTASAPASHLIEGFLPVASIVSASALGGAGLLGITGIVGPATSVGQVTSQADFVLEADRIRGQVGGYDGTGVKVGILSDSFNARGGYAAGVASGDLPAGVVNLLDLGPNGGSDEGRGMAELVHDLAPGAALGFASAFYGEAQFGQSILDLANPAIFGATVITDDIYYFEEPQFQDGLIAQAINEVVKNRNVAYFSSAGNLGSQAYESANVAFDADGWYDFNPGAGVDISQRITLGAWQEMYLNFQWDDPFYTAGGVDTDLDIYLVDPATGETVSYSVRDNIATQTPSELMYFQNGGATKSYDIYINKYSGPASTRLKWVNMAANWSGDIQVDEYATNSGTITPHAAAAGLAVGAAPYFDQLSPEGFTSYGPSYLIFGPTGQRLAATEYRAKPDITATDGADTTFFGGDAEGNGYPNFFGTSAAAPHAAAVAALVRQALPGLSGQQVQQRLIASATDIYAPGFDVRTGAGLINAYDAIFGPAVADPANALDGFESGALDLRWETFNVGSARTSVATFPAAALGSYSLVMDSSVAGFAAPALSEAILHVNLAGRAGARLTFQQKETVGELDDSMPSSFSGHAAADGVAFSVDGLTWYRLVNLVGANSSTSFKYFNVDLGAAAASLGLTLGSDVRIKFQHFLSPSGTLGRFAFDDVKVTALTRAADLVIDDGTAQRSRIRSITLKTVGSLATVPASAFTLTRSGGGTVPVIPAFVVNPDGTTTITLTFPPASLQGGSLPDGRYTLRVDGAQILDDAGNPIDANGAGAAGSIRDVAFHRFFGDSDGDGLVDARDFLAFRNALTGVDLALASIFDSDGDGDVDVADQAAFTSNFRKRKLPV